MGIYLSIHQLHFLVKEVGWKGWNGFIRWHIRFIGRYIEERCEVLNIGMKASNKQRKIISEYLCNFDTCLSNN
jgi:hypothetical protein